MNADEAETNNLIKHTCPLAIHVDWFSSSKNMSCPWCVLTQLSTRIHGFVTDVDSVLAGK